MAQTADVMQLKPPTLLAFDAYVHDSELDMDKAIHGQGSFLWSDLVAERARKIRSGSVVAEFWSGKSPVKIPDGLIHDWVGAAFIGGGTVQRTLALIQDYNDHKNVYKPEVIDSKLISRDGNDFKIYLRLLKRRSSHSFWTLIMTCITKRSTIDAGYVIHSRLAFPRWKMLVNQTRMCCRPIPVTAFFGA